MKFRVNRGDLAASAAWAAKSAAAPGTGVLAGTLIQVISGKVVVSAYNMENTSKHAVDADVLNEGVVLVPATVLAEYVNSLPDGTVEVSVDGDHMHVHCGTANFKILTLPMGSYPTQPKMPSVSGTVDAAEFALAVAQVVAAAGRDKTKAAHLHGVRIEVKGDRMTLVATDQFKLAIRELAWTPAKPDIDAEVLVPRDALETAARSFAGAGQVNIGLSEPLATTQLVGFATAERALVTRQLEAQYPAYRQLLPGTYPIRVLFDANVLVEAVNRAKIAVGSSANALRLTLTGGNLRLRADGEVVDDAFDESLPCEYAGAEFTIGVKAGFFIDAINAVKAAKSDTVTLGLTDPKKPMVVSGDDLDGDVDGNGNLFRFVVMPVNPNRFAAAPAADAA
jgi:DNA polymerase-3 subunit beta